MRVSDGLSTGDSPCRKCTKRKAACHCSCESYAEYKKNNKQVSDKVNLIKQTNHAIMSIRLYKKG